MCPTTMWTFACAFARAATSWCTRRYAQLYHHQSASRGTYNPLTDRKYEDLLRERWRTIFEDGDPYYNPHLTLSGFDFSLRM